MRVVLDTNILVRSAGPGGGPATELFERVITDHSLALSSELIDELGRVRQIHRLSDDEIRVFVESVETGGSLVSLPTPIPRVVLHDPDDDPIVATAVVGQAQVLCTHNRQLFHVDVIAYCRQRGVEIVDDIELLRRFREEERAAGG